MNINQILFNKINSKILICKISLFRELKLVDDIIQPTGISLKPTDNILKEFGKRVKSLDKEIVFNILLDKLNNYENMTEGNNVKSFTVR